MPSYKILPDSTSSLTIVDITHDDGTVRKRVGFHLDYKDAADLQAQLAAAVQANQDTHYAIKQKAEAEKGVAALMGKQQTVKAS